MERSYSQINMDERRKIARWKTAGISITLIAEKLGRHRSTIFRELRRNAFEECATVDLNGYYCVTAHEMARDRRAKLRKLARFSELRQAVEVNPLSIAERNLIEICNRLNSKPRKCLGYKTPAEVFRQKVLAQIRRAG